MAQYCYYNGNTASPIHRVSYNGSTFRKVAVSLSNTTKTYVLETWYSYTASKFPYDWTDYTVATKTNSVSAYYTHMSYSGQARYTNNYQQWDTPYETYTLKFYSYEKNGNTNWGNLPDSVYPVYYLPGFFPFSSSSSTYNWEYSNGTYSVSNPINGRFSVLCTLKPYGGGSTTIPLEGHGETYWQGVNGGRAYAQLSTTFESSLPYGITEVRDYFTDFDVSYRYDGTKATYKREFEPINNPQYFTRNTF